MQPKRIFTLLTVLFVTQVARAQYSQDVIRYSTVQNGSTARIKAIGNAGLAIGGDLSSISINPAGLGFFTKSEVSITPEFNRFGANTDYLGQSSTSHTNTVNFNNLSTVMQYKPDGEFYDLGWHSLNFGLSYNRTNDYYQHIYYAGANSANSISNYYAKLANDGGGVNFTDPYTLQDWAYAHKLIDKYNDGGPAFQSNVFPYNAVPGSKSVNQNNMISRKGGIDEYDIAAGANYQDKLYLGIDIGITSLRYISDNAFNESGVASVLNSGNQVVNANYTSTYNQQQRTSGVGGNVRLGVIYKPDPILRLAATITSPTFYEIADNYTESLTTRYSGGINNSYSNTSDDYYLLYNFNTPFRFSGGAALFMGNHGFITGDVEYINYPGATIFDKDDYSASSDNHNINTLYKPAVNYHAGAEIRIAQLYLRGGYGVQGNPQRYSGSDFKTVSGGLGFRFSNYYFDATYTNVQGAQNITPFLTSNGNPQATANQTYENFFITFGMRFNSYRPR